MLARRAFLGAELADEAFVDGGMKLAAVSEGGMAARAGLRAGDVIVSIAGKPVGEPRAVKVALRKAGEDPTCEIAFVRGGQRETVNAAVIEQPAEALESVSYGELLVEGVRLRTISTRVDASRALIVYLQDCACDSIDQGQTPDSPLAGLLTGWAEARFDSLRFDKRGLGDSEGEPCETQGFDRELADARAAVGRAKEMARARGIPLVVFGHGAGGVMAAMLAGDFDVKSLIAFGTPSTRWLRSRRDAVREQLVLDGAEAEVDAELAAMEEVMNEGELDGRTAAYHLELDAVDLEATWRQINIPVLILRGQCDWVVTERDQARIGELAANAKLVVLDGVDHQLGHHANRDASLRDAGFGRFDASIVKATVDWIDKLAKAR